MDQANGYVFQFSEPLHLDPDEILPIDLDSLKEPFRFLEQPLSQSESSVIDLPNEPQEAQVDALRYLNPPGLPTPIEQFPHNNHLHLPGQLNIPIEDQPQAIANNEPAVGGQTPSPELRCNRKCKGDLIGPHDCQRLKRKLHVTCLSGECKHVFYTKNDFNRHCKTRHGFREALLDCTVPGCARVGNSGFSRRDNMLQHLREVHGEDIQRVRVRICGSKRVIEA